MSRKKEYVPKSIYVTNQPVVVLTLEQLEDIYEVHIAYQEREKLTIQKRAELDQKMETIHRQLRDEVRNARKYFKVQSVRKADKSRKVGDAPPTLA